MGIWHPILARITPVVFRGIFIPKVRGDTCLILIQARRTNLEETGHLTLTRPTLKLLTHATTFFHGAAAVRARLGVDDAVLSNFFSELLKRVCTDTCEGDTGPANLHETNKGDLAQSFLGGKLTERWTDFAPKGGNLH
jgi:hypothetical protein